MLLRPFLGKTQYSGASEADFVAICMGRALWIRQDCKRLQISRVFPSKLRVKNDVFSCEKMVSQMTCFLGDFWGPRAPGARSAAILRGSRALQARNAAIYVGRATWRPGVLLFTWVARPGGQ